MQRIADSVSTAVMHRAIAEKPVRPVPRIAESVRINFAREEGVGLILERTAEPALRIAESVKPRVETGSAMPPKIARPVAGIAVPVRK